MLHKQKFKEIKTALLIQEQTTGIILKKNLAHIEEHLMQTKKVPQRFFDDLDEWNNLAKRQLDELADHVEDAEWINFDMLEPKDSAAK